MAAARRNIEGGRAWNFNAKIAEGTASWAAGVEFGVNRLDGAMALGIAKSHNGIQQTQHFDFCRAKSLQFDKVRFACV